MQTTTIYLVRHGESHSNAGTKDPLSSTNNDSNLTDTGKMQAQELAKKFKDIPFTAAYASDLTRAKHTAEIIAAPHHLSVISSPLIRERDNGVNRSSKTPEVRDFLTNVLYAKNDIPEEEKFALKLPPDMESGNEVLARMKIFFKEVSQKHKGQTILVVCHGNAMRTFLMHLGFAKHHELPTGHLKNTGYIKLETDGENFKVIETEGVHKII